MNLREQTSELCANWRRNNPSCSDWSDTEVIEAIMIRLCETNPERVTSRRGADGVLVFKILPPALLGSNIPLSV